MRGSRLGAIASLLAIAFVIAIALWARLSWTADGPAARDMIVQVERGSSLYAMADTLEKAGAIDSAERFRLLARLFGDDKPIKFGEYQIPKASSPAEILRILQSGQPLQRLITVPEGMPSIMVYERLMAEPLLTGSIEVPVEGSVLPDSYSFERGETRQAVLDRMQAAMKRTLDKLWAERKPTTVVKSPDEAIILASVVEKETSKPSERRMVAGVYSNRLRVGMKLDADPTIIYPVTKGKPLRRRIRVSELRADNACRRDRSPIPVASRSPRCSTRPRQMRSISSPMAPAAMFLRQRSPSTTPTSSNGGRSGERAESFKTGAGSQRQGGHRQSSRACRIDLSVQPVPPPGPTVEQDPMPPAS